MLEDLSWLSTMVMLPPSVLINKRCVTWINEYDRGKMAKAIENEGQMEIYSINKDYILGRTWINGRTIVDDQGAMILADKAEINWHRCCNASHPEVRATVGGELMQPARSIKRQSALHMHRNMVNQHFLRKALASSTHPLL